VLYLHVVVSVVVGVVVSVLDVLMGFRVTTRAFIGFFKELRNNLWMASER